MKTSSRKLPVGLTGSASTTLSAFDAIQASELRRKAAFGAPKPLRARELGVGRETVDASLRADGAAGPGADVDNTAESDDDAALNILPAIERFVISRAAYDKLLPDRASSSQSEK